MTRVVWWGTVSTMTELLGTMRQFADRNTVYIELPDMGLCYIDCDEEVIEMFGRGEYDVHPITSLGKDAFPTLVVVTGAS